MCGARLFLIVGSLSTTGGLSDLSRTLIKVQLSNMQIVATYGSAAAYMSWSYQRMIVDADHVFYTALGEPFRKIRLSDMSLVADVTISDNMIWVVSDGQGYAYIGTQTRQIVKVRLSDMQIVGTLETGTGANDGILAGLAVGPMGYFGPTHTTKKVLKYTLNAGTDALPSLQLTGLTLSNTEYTAGAFPPPGSGSTQTLMRTIAKDVDGGSTSSLVQGVLDQTGTCKDCVRVNLSKMIVTTTETRQYTLLTALGAIGGFAGIVMFVLGLLDIGIMKIRERLGSGSSSDSSGDAQENYCGELSGRDCNERYEI